MKKFLILPFILCVNVLFAQTPRGTSSMFGKQPRPQEFKPILSTVQNTISEQNKMLGNTYPLAVYDKDNRPENHQPGGGTAFRIHKNWFLTCAHGPFMKMNDTQHKPVLNVGVSIEERQNTPGASAPFFLVIDLAATDEEANGRVYMFNPNLTSEMLGNRNENRGDDLALIYVPDRNPAKVAFDKAKQEIETVKAQFNNLQGAAPISFFAQAENNISAVYKKASAEWNRFLNYPINPFKLLILSEENIISELGYKNVTSKYFPLTTYYILEDKVKTFTFNPIGTHPGTHAIFYERVNNLEPGTSGSPMTYGNFVISVDSATNCSPMLTENFYNWLKSSMGKDYTPMCVKPSAPSSSGSMSGNIKPVYAPTDPNWNNALPQG